jgi:hypothetical protein
MVFSAHPWFTTHALEEDQEDVCLSVRTIPLSVRMNWLKRLRHSKVQFLFSGSGSVNGVVGYNQEVSSSSSSTYVRASTYPHEGLGLESDSTGDMNDTSCTASPVKKASRLSEAKTHDFYASKQESSRRPFPNGLIIPPPPPAMSDTVGMYICIHIYMYRCI